MLLHAGGARRSARGGPGARGDLPLRRPLPGSPAATRCPRRAPAADPRFRDDRRPRPRARRRDLRSGHAGRLDPRPVRRDADVQLLRGRRRRDDEDHPRDPRQRSPLEHAEADPLLRGARLPVAGVRPHPDDPRRGPEAPLEAPRRDVRARVPRRGLPARGDGELLRAPRLGPRRPGGLLQGRADPALRPRPGRRHPGHLRPDEARVAEPDVDEATGRGPRGPRGARERVRAAPRAGRDHQPAAGARHRRAGQPRDTGDHARRDGAEGALLLRGSGGLRSDRAGQAGDAGPRPPPRPAPRAARRARALDGGRARGRLPAARRRARR